MAKVLLVEDDDNLREIFEMRLQAEGYQTATATNGEDALVTAIKEKPDLIVADVMMPKLSGFEMLETLRAAPETKGIKVVMMTALGQAEDQARGEKLGVLKYLVKSQVTLEDFAKAVREILPPGKQEQSSTNTNQESEKHMPDDTSAPTNPTPGGGDNPISDPGDSGLGSSVSGQMNSDDEKKEVEDQVEGWKDSATTPTPTPDTPAPMPAPGGSDMPATTPADDSTTPAAPPSGL